MARKKHLIIGCGAAGLSALKQIRKSGSEDKVKLVTMEKPLALFPHVSPLPDFRTQKKKTRLSSPMKTFLKDMTLNSSKASGSMKSIPGASGWSMIAAGANPMTPC